MLKFLIKIKIKILNRILEDEISFEVLLRGNISTTYYLGKVEFGTWAHQ